MDEDKIVLDTIEIVYRHYLWSGMERTMLEEPVIVRHSAVMGDREFPRYALNNRLEILKQAVLERADKG